MAGQQKREQKMKRVCTESMCSNGCDGPEEKWEVTYIPCTPPTTCSTSCDCDNPYDVCESGICVDRTPPASCIPGTLAKGDKVCQWVCQGADGIWGCQGGVKSCTPAGQCKGSGYDASLFKVVHEDEVRNGCRTQYRDQYLEIDVSQFKRGNIYKITQGQTFSEEVRSGDTPRAVLERLASKINAQHMTYPTLCNGAGSTVVTTATVVSSNRLKYHINWQHSTSGGGSRSCNQLSEDECNAATGCNWDITSANYCTGWNYTVEQGVCSGSYSRPACVWNGMGMGTTYDGGSTYGGGGATDPGCEYMFYDQESCNSTEAQSKGCYWGTKPQTCYAGSQADCYALGGSCSWKSYPDLHRSCTGAYGESQCTEDGAGVCSWGPAIAE